MRTRANCSHDFLPRTPLVPPTRPLSLPNYGTWVRHLHLVDCAYACLTHVGLEARRAQGQNKNKNVLRLPPIQQLKADLRRVVWNEAVKEVAKVSHERTVIRRLEKLLAA